MQMGGWTDRHDKTNCSFLQLDLKVSPVTANLQVWQQINNCHLLQVMMKHFLKVHFLSVNLKLHVQKFSTIILFHKRDVINETVQF